jgi:hypothetical protein
VAKIKTPTPPELNIKADAGAVIYHCFIETAAELNIASPRGKLVLHDHISLVSMNV